MQIVLAEPSDKMIKSLSDAIDKEIIADLKKAAFDPFFFDTIFEEKCDASCEDCSCEKK